MARKTISIKLYKSEMLNEVMNKTYLTGNAHDLPEVAPEIAARMIANEDDENIYQIRRTLTNAFAQIKVKLAEYVDDTSTSSTNDMMSVDDASTTPIILTLKMPSNFNTTSNDSIASAVHSFLVNRAIGEWFSITSKEEAATYFTMSDACIGQLREALSRRVRPTYKAHATSVSSAEGSGGW